MEIQEAIKKTAIKYGVTPDELKIEDLIKLCDFYNVSSDYFIGRKDK